MALSKKNVLVLSSGDVHGAYEAAFKITKYLNKDNFNAILLVKQKTKSEKFVVQVHSQPIGLVKRISNRLRSKIFSTESKLTFQPKYYFFDEDENKEYFNAKYLLNYLQYKPDLILVGMTDNFVTTKTLVALEEITKAKIFMITMDMFPLTGGCHYAWDCKGYQHNCTNCPAGKSEKEKKWVAKNFENKADNIKRANINILTGSGWTLNQARASTFFKNQSIIHNVNSLIDTTLFNNKNRSFAKNIFDIDQNSKVVFTGSWNINDQRKGISFFLEALNYCWNNISEEIKEQVVVLVAGESYGNSSFLDQIPFKKKLIPFIKDYRLLSLAYQASDIFVCASVEDSGPMMVSEALGCGTPVIGFNMGVVSNMVITGYNGYKAELRDSTDLGKGLCHVLELNEYEFLQYSKNAVKQVEEHSSINTFLNIMNTIVNQEFSN
jgi:glycosyltransferase involved in cell wall biosynthesis